MFAISKNKQITNIPLKGIKYQKIAMNFARLWIVHNQNLLMRKTKYEIKISQSNVKQMISIMLKLHNSH